MIYNLIIFKFYININFSILKKKTNSEVIYSSLKIHKLKPRKNQYITSNHLRYKNSIERSPFLYIRMKFKSL